MPVESAAFISQLDATYPASGDPKAEGDNHLRLIKIAVKGTFPNLTAAPVTPTTNDLNTLANAATTGAAGLKLVKPTIGSNDTQAANTAFVSEAVAAASFSTNLPSQSGNAGKVIKTDGTNATWQAEGLAVAIVSATTQTAVSGAHYVLTNVAATTVTLPASPASGDTVWVTPTNGLTTNVIARNAQTIMGLAENMTMDSANATVNLRFINGSWRLV